jgi:acid phosphatase
MSSRLFLLIYLIAKADAIDFRTSWTISAGPTYSSYKFNVLQHLAAISPYFESNSEGLSPDPPPGCAVDRAVYQVRHGSIYANEYDYVHTIQPFLQRLKNFSDHGDFSNSPDLAFLRRWNSPISNSEEQVTNLAKLGFLEAFSLGNRLAQRYPNLMPVKKKAPFTVWTSDSNRTRRSAEALFAGLYSGHEEIGQIVKVSEDKDRGADTLTPTKTCPKFDVSDGVTQAEVWLKHYTLPTIARLNAQLPGFQFSAVDVLAMQELCGYETITRGTSLLCGIFTADEWLSFEYYFDIKYHYELGYGNDLSPNLGMPWVVASSDLLSETDSKDQRLYISVAHRQIVPLILTALGLHNDSKDLDASDRNPIFPLDRMNYRRSWKSSNFISFLGHIALERLDCRSAPNTGSFVRILVNAAPQPLPGCDSGPGASCPLEQYKNYIKRRKSEYDDFSKACGTREKKATDVLSFFAKEKIF